MSTHEEKKKEQREENEIEREGGRKSATNGERVPAQIISTTTRTNQSNIHLCSYTAPKTAEHRFQEVTQNKTHCHRLAASGTHEEQTNEGEYNEKGSSGMRRRPRSVSEKWTVGDEGGEKRIYDST